MGVNSVSSKRMTPLCILDAGNKRYRNHVCVMESILYHVCAYSPFECSNYVDASANTFKSWLFGARYAIDFRLPTPWDSRGGSEFNNLFLELDAVMVFFGIVV